MREITELPLNSICTLLNKKEISSVELTRSYLEKIQESGLNAFITVTDTHALLMAAEADSRRARGECLHLLEGVPFALKDNICVEGIPTSCGSKMLRGFVSPYTATAAERILAAGGVLLGKTNMDEFGMGSHSDTSYYGAVVNPLDGERSPGGSSGGSSAAVAAGLAAYALGSDTGGSVRLPSAFCGVTGIKPTYGAVSRYGLVAFASSLDQIGVITKDIAGNAAVLDLISGKDKMDATSLEIKESFIPSGMGETVRVGVADFGGVSPEVKAAVERAAEILKSRGAQVSFVELPSADMLISSYYIISACEASSNLARYDGMRYGNRAEEYDGIDSLFANSRTEGFGDEVKRRIMLGTFCLSRGERDKYYKRAIAAREDIKAKLDKIFDSCDVLLSPISYGTAPRLAEKSARPLDIYRQDAFSVVANLVGLPALCVPVPNGESSEPAAVQLMGKRLSEKLLYTLGQLIEKEVTK